MVFGYQQGGSFSQHKQALGFDAATSEQMRLKHMAEQRKKDLQMRARQDLQSRQVRLRIVKSEISRMESESRRLSASESKINGSHGHVENFDQKLKELKSKLREIENEIQKISSEKQYAEKVAGNNAKELLIIKERKKHEDAEIVKFKDEEKKLESEIRELERISRGI